MSESNRNLLGFGVFILLIVVSILLYMGGLIDWTLIVPVILLLSGVWLLVLGVIRANKPFKYERSSFSTILLGLLIISIGGAWIVFRIDWLYSVIVILLVIAVITIVTAIKRK